MKTILISFLLFLFSLGAVADAHAQQGRWQALGKEVRSLHEKKQYDRALVLAQEALTLAEQARGANHPDVAVSLTDPID